MYDFIDKMLDDLPPDMDGTARTPAAEHLFTVNPEPKPLTARTPAAEHLFTVNPEPKPLKEEIATMFHHNVAKILFLCKQVCPDLRTSVVFLSTHVKSLDEDHYKKLA